MTKLFLDIGNTRIKRAVIDNNQYHYLDAFSIEEFLVESDPKRLVGEYKLDSIYITSVTSLDNLELIKSVIQQACGIFPIVLTSQKSNCGLTTGYDDFHKLGDDRWMAMQGAIGLFKQPVIIVSAGTAMTVDAILDGKHLGGFIVPGLTSLRAALASDTAALSFTKPTELKESETAVDHSLLASNTESAILGGTLYMTAAFLNTIVKDLNSQVETLFKVVMTGGNASKLCSLLDYECEVIPDLILHGMINIEESVKKV